MSENKRKIKIYTGEGILRSTITDLLALYRLDEGAVFCDEINDAGLILDSDGEEKLRAGEILDRIRYNLSASTIIQPETDVEIGPYMLRASDSLLLEGDKQIQLTEKERDILLKLYQKSGEVIDKNELLEDVWGYAENVETHTLETHIYRLRQKIEKDPASPEILLTDGNGYRLS